MTREFDILIAWQDLSMRERAEIGAAALQKLDEDEAAVILEAMERLQEALTQVGRMGALELITAIALVCDGRL